MLTTGIFSLAVFWQHGDIMDGELSGDKIPDAGRNMIHTGEKGAQKTLAPYLQGNSQTIVIARAFADNRDGSTCRAEMRAFKSVGYSSFIMHLHCTMQVHYNPVTHSSKRIDSIDVI